MNLLLIIPLAVSFIVTFLIVPIWVKRARLIGLVGRDINKYDKPEVAEVGGIAVIAGFVLGVLSYIAIETFTFDVAMNLTSIFALLSVILILAFVAMVDSLLATKVKLGDNPDMLGWRAGLRKKYRLLLCFFAAVPLIAINAGVSEVSIPLLGEVQLGLLYPLVLIPLGVLATSTTFNFLAGFNGLEASQGVIILSGLSFVAYMTGSAWLALIGLVMVFSLIAFLFFNRFPAKVFPSDVLTYPVGGMIAIIAILGNIEKIAIFFFIPYIAEVLLKCRGKLKKQSFGKPNKDSSLEMPYEKIYGMTHLAIWVIGKFKKKVYERDVVYFINAVQIFIIVLGLVIFKEGIF